MGQKVHPYGFRLGYNKPWKSRWFTKKRMAKEVEKVLRSAIANAEGKSETIDVDDLYVSEAYANDGPRAKRIRPAPMGRAHPYQRRTCHIVVKVAEKVASAPAS